MKYNPTLNTNEILNKFARNPIVYEIKIDSDSSRIYIRPFTKIKIVENKVYEEPFGLDKESLPIGSVVNEEQFISKPYWKVDKRNASKVLLDILDYSNKIAEKNNINYIDIPKRYGEDLYITLERELRKADFLDIDLTRYDAPHYIVFADSVTLNIINRKIDNIDKFIKQFYNSVVEATKIVEDPIEGALIVTQFIYDIYKVKEAGLGWFFDVTANNRTMYDVSNIFEKCEKFINLGFIEKFSKEQKELKPRL